MITSAFGQAGSALSGVRTASRRRWSAPAKRHKNKPDLLALFLLQFLSRRGEEQRAGESERRLSSGPFLARRRGVSA